MGTRKTWPAAGRGQAVAHRMGCMLIGHSPYSSMMLLARCTLLSLDCLRRLALFRALWAAWCRACPLGTIAFRFGAALDCWDPPMPGPQWKMRPSKMRSGAAQSLLQAWWAILGSAKAPGGDEKPWELLTPVGVSCLPVPAFTGSLGWHGSSKGQTSPPRQQSTNDLACRLVFEIVLGLHAGCCAVLTTAQQVPGQGIRFA